MHFQSGVRTKDGAKSQERLLDGKPWEGAKGSRSVQEVQGLKCLGIWAELSKDPGMQLKEWLASSENPNPREIKLILGLTESREQELKGTTSE